MSNNRNLGNLANVLDNGTSGQVLTSQGSGVATFADAAGGSSVTTVTNVSGASDSLTAISSPSVGDIVFVTSTNGLFIRKSNGWFKIADVTNEVPNSLTGVSDSALAIDGTATTITLAATDPEGLALTFSAAAKTGSSTTFSAALTDGNTVNALNGSTVIATVAQASNVFTITPNTASNSGTVDITFSVTDGINTALTDDGQFTLTFVTIVTDSNHTTLLATATGTSDNNNITDSSSNSHSITVNGDAYAGTFSPYRSGGYSTEFVRASSQRFELSGLSAIGSGDFSIEFWVYSTSDDWMVLCERSGSSNNGFELYKNGNNQTLRMRIGNTNYDTLTTGTVISKNEWHFVQIVRESNTIKIYINDIDQSLDSSTSNSTNLSVTSDFLIGGRSSYYVDGYIRDFRISTTARSKAVPSEPLTADSNTLFITCHKPYIIYETPSATSSISVDGNPSTKPFSPYDYDEYGATGYGGSVYLDGNTDTIQATSTMSINQDGFSASLWYYPTLAQGVLFSSASNHIGTLSFTGSLSSSEIRYEYKNSSGSNTTLIGSNAVTPIYFTWNYLQIVQDSNGHIRIYSNGTQVGSTVTNAAMSGASSTAVTIGDWGSSGSSSGFQGYISDFNLTTETSPSTAVPTAPRSSAGNTKLLISGTDASIIDKAQGSNLKLVGNTTGSTDLGTNSDAYSGSGKYIKFDGSGDRVTATGVLDLGDDFTIECWVYSTTTGNRGVVSSIDNVGNWGGNGYWSFGLYGSGPSLQIDGGSYSGASTSVSTNQWVHIAVTRTSNTIRYFINGTRDSTTFSNSLTLKNPSGIVIGSSPNNNYIYNYTGYIQDLRIANECKYTAADESANIPSAPLEG